MFFLALFISCKMSATFFYIHATQADIFNLHKQ